MQSSATNNTTNKWPCDIPACEKRFKKKSHLIRHLKAHSGERPYSCVKCGKAYGRQEHLTRHQLSHSGECKFVCQANSCGKAFIDRTHLKRHEWTHCKPHSCDVCSNTFNKFSQLLKHKMRHELTVATSDRPQYRCPHSECATFYMSMSGLKKHLKGHESANIYSCSSCRNQYVKYTELVAHRKTAHHNYKCHICHEQFSRLSRMNVHIQRVHKGKDEAIDIGGELVDLTSYMETSFEKEGGKEEEMAELSGETSRLLEKLSRELGEYSMEYETDAKKAEIDMSAAGDDNCISSGSSEQIFVDLISFCETI